MEKEVKKLGRKKLGIIITIAVLAVAGVGVGAYFAIRAVYSSGVSEGREAMATEMADNLKALGVAIMEKSEFQEKVGKILAEIPSEVNTEKIDEYIAKLEKLVDEVTTKDVLPVINNYLAKWREFRDIYAGQDNGAISEAFDTLKATATDTASKIQTTYDEAIKGAIEGL
ncbi:hypothetical protein IKE79_01050 [Candidatus Saccharibacteria bacterium]|nr:hypothetical protein [Candidatus Saccharibacteria bacterium]